ncbi:MAG: LysR family transcriptional regulator [Azospirillaceae bacterium]|nr:LysR family transcriptional regulator [Azospirillaceae bacterium]
MMTPSSDQILVFLAVVDSGSFSAAARALRRTQSAVTYAVQTLEATMDVVLFDRSARLPVLTAAGAALLPNARRIAQEIDALRARIAGLHQGLETELTLVVDAMFPMCHLLVALKAFAAAFPSVPTRIYVESLGAAAQLVLDQTCMVGILGPVAVNLAGLDRFPAAPIKMVPVVAPSHPLAAGGGRVADEDIRDHVQLVLTDRSELTQGQMYNVFSTRNWRLADLGAKHAMALAGLGWGFLPLHLIDGDLAEGRLVRLHGGILGRPETPTSLPMFFARRANVASGPAARWMLAYLTEMPTDTTHAPPPRLHPFTQPLAVAQG